MAADPVGKAAKGRTPSSYIGNIVRVRCLAVLRSRRPATPEPQPVAIVDGD